MSYAGIVRTFYDEEETKLKQIYFQINQFNNKGIKEGEFKEYFEDGQIFEICNYVNGKMHGKYQSYYKNGQPYITCTYVDGILKGQYTSYHINGDIEENTFLN